MTNRYGTEREPEEPPFLAFPEAALASSVMQRFDDIAGRFPERLAVSDGAHSWSFAELAAKADEIAGSVAGLVGEHPGPVAILLKNEPRFAAAVLALLRCGCPYVPLDADHPHERNRRIADHAGVVAAISSGRFADEARAMFASSVPLIDLDSLATSGQDRPTHQSGPADIAYITYTSGSRGRPKGVYQNQRGLLHDVMQSTNTLRLSAGDRQPLFHSPSLINGTRILLGALLNGGSVHMMPPRDLRPSAIAAEIRARGITVFRSVPALFREVVDTLAPDEKLDSLRLVYLGGDRVRFTAPVRIHYSQITATLTPNS